MCITCDACHGSQVFFLCSSSSLELLWLLSRLYSPSLVIRVSRCLILFPFMSSLSQSRLRVSSLASPVCSQSCLRVCFPFCLCVSLSLQSVLPVLLCHFLVLCALCLVKFLYVPFLLCQFPCIQSIRVYVTFPFSYFPSCFLCFFPMFTFHLCKVCALVSVSVFMLPVLFWRQCFVFSPLQKPKFKVSQYMFQQ